jgi:hypothetical protein
MHGRTSLILMGVLALVVAAPEVATARVGGTDRPVVGTGSGTTAFNIATVPFPATAEATVTLSHLGTGTQSLDYVIVPQPNGLFSVVGTSTLVAANGDKLFTAFSGLGPPSDTRVNSVITGGTGRFDGATGTMNVMVVTQTNSVVGTTVSGNQTFTFEGTISY